MIDKAVLVSSPYNLSKWKAQLGHNEWTASESPHSVVSRIDPETKIYLIVGKYDENTAPNLSREYVRVLRSRGISADLIEVPGAGHNFRELQYIVLETIWRISK